MRFTFPARLAALAALGACAAAGCHTASEQCDSYTCNMLGIATQAAEPGSSVTFRGVPMQIERGSVPEGDPTPSKGRCYVGLEPYLWSESSDGATVSWTVFVTLHCTWLDGRQVAFGATIDDLDATSPDPIPLTAEGWRDDDGEGSADAFYALEGELFIEESAGGEAPVPDVVTPDYERVIRFQIGPVQRDDAAPDLQVRLRFRLTADAFHFEQGAECRVCVPDD